MRRFTVVVAIASLLGTTPATAKSWPCHFTAHRVIGCRGIERADTAVFLWRKFGFNTDNISSGQRMWIAQNLCNLIVSDPGKTWKIYLHGRGRLPTPDGYEPIVNVFIPERGIWFVMSSHYLTGQCPIDKGIKIN